MDINYTNENFLFYPGLRDRETKVPIPVETIQSVEVVLINAFTGREWVKFRHPQSEGFKAVRVEGNKLACEISLTESETAPPGRVEAFVTFRVNDSRFEVGYQQFTREFTFTILKKAT